MRASIFFSVSLLLFLAIVGYVSTATVTGSSSTSGHPKHTSKPPVTGYRHSHDDDYDGQQTEQEDLNQFSKKGGQGGQKTQAPQKGGSSAQLTSAALCSSIKTGNGVLRGKLVKSKTGKDICAFLGVPYAKPPLGDLRFQRPVPKGNWEGTLDASTLPNTCWQPLFEEQRGTDWYPNTKLSEDCLYLNLWVPVSILRTRADNQSATVMIWIHGGGLTFGSASFDLYNGEILAGDQDVIVATINYRLGAFGFIYLNCAEAPGNMGLLDQHMAIKWMKDNVANFGGNQYEMTIFGESAGSMSVAHHLLSPMSLGLFKRAILQSGVATGPTMYRDPEGSLVAWLDFAQKMGCLSQNKSGFSKATEDLSEVIKCLQGVEPSKVANFESMNRKFLDLSGSATVDGYFLPDTPKNLLKNHEFGARADIIIGAVENEGTMFLLMDLLHYFPHTPKKPPIPHDTFVKVMRIIFREKSLVEQNAIISHYTNWINVDDSEENMHRIAEAAGDYVIVCPSVDFAMQWAARGHRVYAYDFTHRSSNHKSPEWIGVQHCDEIEYVFGRVVAQTFRPKAEQDLSREMQRLFTQFAKTGVPSDKWETFTRARPVFLNLNATLISPQSTPNVFGPRAQACAFWNQELPLLKKYYDEAQSCRAAAGSFGGGGCGPGQQPQFQQQTNSPKCSEFGVGGFGFGSNQGHPAQPPIGQTQQQSCGAAGRPPTVIHGTNNIPGNFGGSGQNQQRPNLYMA